MIKAILFDFDGTLLDTDSLIKEAYKYLFKKYKADYVLSEEELDSFIGPTLKSVFPKYFKEDFSLLLKEFHEFSFKHILEYAKVYDGLFEMLELLNSFHYKLGIVTNRFKNSLDMALAPFSLEKYFSCFVTLDDVLKPKPDQEPINVAINQLNVKKEEVIFIGDSFSDIKAGINAGVKTCLVAWSKIINQIKADYVLTSYKNLFEDLHLEVEK